MTYDEQINQTTVGNIVASVLPDESHYPEIWKCLNNEKDIGYIISNYGRLYNGIRQELVQWEMNDTLQMYFVDIEINGWTSHVPVDYLVASTFLDNPNDTGEPIIDKIMRVLESKKPAPTVKHLNGNLCDCRASNLAW